MTESEQSNVDLQLMIGRNPITIVQLILSRATLTFGSRRNLCCGHLDSASAQIKLNPLMIRYNDDYDDDNNNRSSTTTIATWSFGLNNISIAYRTTVCLHFATITPVLP